VYDPLTTSLVFTPEGFGRSSYNKQGDYNGDYPGPATMQYMSLTSAATTGLYIGAHDTQSLRKNLRWNHYGFAVNTFPSMATHPIATYTSEFPIVIAALPKSSPAVPGWFSSSQQYSSFLALASPPWLSRGGIRARLSPALLATNLWLNTGWQCHDIFEELEGDPATVYTRTKALLTFWRTLGLTSPVAMHWYEWQQGPDSEPSSRYKFDTHYPDYFPGRVSENADTVTDVAARLLAEFNVTSYPYINGRIFDTTSDSYFADDGVQYCVKSLKNPKLFDPANELDVTIESYGSGPSFCVANPQQEYWQDKVADVVVELAEDYKMNGVYIDQIGAAPMDLCFDSTHGHALGNGAWWRDGYATMKDKMVEQCEEKGIEMPMIVTEANAENYMDVVEGFLTLTAYQMSFASDSDGEGPYQVPAFAAVYGGHYNAFGAEFYANDFKDKQWLRAKLSYMWARGVQLGWMGLGGIEDDMCGDMGLYDTLMDEENLDCNQFLIDLVEERSLYADFFLDGKLGAGVAVQAGKVSIPQTAESKGQCCDIFYYDEVVTSVWKNGEEVAVLVVNVAEGVIDGGRIVLDWAALGKMEGDTVEVEMRGNWGKQVWKNEFVVKGAEMHLDNVKLELGVNSLLLTAPK